MPEKLVKTPISRNSKKPKTMNRKPHIAVVGAANIDLTAMPHTKYIPQDSCPGSIAIS